MYDAWDLVDSIIRAVDENMEVGVGHTLVLRQSECRNVVAAGEHSPAVAADSEAVKDNSRPRGVHCLYRAITV